MQDMMYMTQYILVLKCDSSLVKAKMLLDFGS